ncbi:hypothetical protein IL38_23970 [Actinopolyspora erythraea]|uniref:DUF4395 domain-containing protein n=1 Tax=Actinopolyspora erythraea TaxID=414996 RepID=A0ABR4WY92_9ACTN|nr:hypothetical protein [Actinopolyspora erythraea]KGI79359.1 hypothetical protein IL38_23970 [Actinopolyspora erythraea]
MSTSASGDPFTARYTRWVAHRYARFILVIGGALTTMQFATDTVPLVTPLVEGSVSLLALIGFVMIVIPMHRHTRLLCPDCAADVPNNPSAAAETDQHRLRRFHQLSTPRGSLLGLAGILLLLLGQHWLGPLGFLATLLAWSGIAYEHVLVHRHRLLMPWCPYCRNGGDGDDHTAPTPDPVRTATR